MSKSNKKFQTLPRLFIWPLACLLALPLYGCGDWGIKFWANRQKNMPASTESEEASSETSPEESLDNIEETLNATFNELAEEVENAAQKAKNTEDAANEADNSNPEDTEEALKTQYPDLQFCQEITLPEECPETADPACVLISLQSGTTKNQEWLQFENACTACKIQAKAEESALQILGFRAGACSTSNSVPAQ